jgi:hypothetical protein
MTTNVTFDLTKNPKQVEFFLEVMKACNGLNKYRKFGYGGAIRGGKTFVCLGTLIRLCEKYPGSKWHIIRQDFPALQKTTIPSFEKIIRGSKNWNWNRDKANYYAYNKYDSKIFFMGENISQDPELYDFLGLETNGVFLEQLEELSKKLWDISLSRCGSWYLDKMPPAMMLTTLNPTQKWPKEFLHDAYMMGQLPPDFFYMTATPKDNAFVTEDQWNAWGSMDERYQKQFIEGDWTDFDATDNRFAYCYDKKKNVAPTHLDPSKEVYLSFDFNHDPISCCVFQHSGNSIRVIEQIKLANSNIYQICDVIKAKYGRCMLIVTGDATGKATSALVKDNINYYTVIKSKLDLSISQMKVPNINPSLEENRVLVNYVLKNVDILIDPINAKALLYDLEHARVLPDGSLDKKNRHDPTEQLDALDCLRYYLNTFWHHVLRMA